jgi:hypothetical protein
MKLVACGDSWAWGAELVDPVVEPIPLFNLPGDSFSRQYKPENMAYRLKYRYTNQFASLIGADEVVDLSRCSYSNDAIVRTLIEWLSVEGYTTGRDISDLFVTIGWTSPERREFFYKERWGDTNWMEYGPWSMDRDHNNPEVDQFMRLYFDNFWHQGEFIHRWILQLWQTELMLKSLNIKYVMHQAFYHHHQQMINQWNDKVYKENMIDGITKGDKMLWDNLDSKRFMHKDDQVSTAHHYMLSQLDNDPTKAFIVMHPSADGHTVWASHMYQYCLENNLL